MCPADIAWALLITVQLAAIIGQLLLIKRQTFNKREDAMDLVCSDKVAMLYVRERSNNKTDLEAFNECLRQFGDRTSESAMGRSLQRGRKLFRILRRAE